MDTKRVKCPRCKRVVDEKAFCEFLGMCYCCSEINRVEHAKNTYDRIYKYIESGQILSDVKAFADWSKRKKVEVSFDPAQHDPLQDNIGDVDSILILKKEFSRGGRAKCILVGQIDGKWWGRAADYQRPNRDEDGPKIHRLIIGTATYFPHDDFRRAEGRTALISAFVQATRPLL